MFFFESLSACCRSSRLPPQVFQLLPECQELRRIFPGVGPGVRDDDRCAQAAEAVGGATRYHGIDWIYLPRVCYFGNDW
jgi:hypothetical protein